MSPRRRSLRRTFASSQVLANLCAEGKADSGLDDVHRHLTWDINKNGIGEDGSTEWKLRFDNIMICMIPQWQEVGIWCKCSSNECISWSQTFREEPKWHRKLSSVNLRRGSQDYLIVSTGYPILHRAQYRSPIPIVLVNEEPGIKPRWTEEVKAEVKLVHFNSITMTWQSLITNQTFFAHMWDWLLAKMKYVIFAMWSSSLTCQQWASMRSGATINTPWNSTTSHPHLDIFRNKSPFRPTTNSPGKSSRTLWTS